MNVFQKCYECTLKDVAKAQELPWSTPTAAFSKGFVILMTATKMPIPLPNSLFLLFLLRFETLDLVKILEKPLLQCCDRNQMKAPK